MSTDNEWVAVKNQVLKKEAFMTLKQILALKINMILQFTGILTHCTGVIDRGSD